MSKFWIGLDLFLGKIRNHLSKGQKPIVLNKIFSIKMREFTFNILL